MSNERVIMNSSTNKILCWVNAKTIYEVLGLPEIFPKNTESFIEEVLVKLYGEYKSQDRPNFLSQILKDGQTHESLTFPLNVNIFQKDVQLVLCLLTQFLGHGDDKSISEVMLGFILKINLPNSESSQPCFFNFDELPDGVIHA